MMVYDARAWYWRGQPLGQSETVIYSSAKGGLVPETDADYCAFIAVGGSPTPWPKDVSGVATPAALDDVLIAAGLPGAGLAAPKGA